MKVSMIGLDIAKNVFHLVGQTRSGREVLKKRLRRAQVIGYFAQCEPCVVGIETCSGAHHFGRELERLGHTVRLVPARAVKPYVTGAKNDDNDAAAICEALKNPRLHPVAVKSVAQQDLQALHRLREAAHKERTALANRLRGVLAEYGLVMPKGIATLRARLPALLEDGENGFSALLRELLAEHYEALCELDARVQRFDQRLRRVQREHPAARRLSEVRGLGPVLASALPAFIGDGHQYASARGFAAAIGLVPHQASTGGKTRLLGISKRGNRYLRNAFIHGARAVLNRAGEHDDRLSRWALRVRARRGTNRATVALAHKLARIAWVVLARAERFDPAHA